MSYYPLSTIEQCLPVEQEKKWTYKGAFDIPKILNLEFYKLFGLAISKGAIKTYSASGRLNKTTTSLSLQTLLNEKEVNAWLKAEKLPYAWRPEKIKPRSLENLIENGELKTDCVEMAHALRARGDSSRGNKQIEGCGRTPQDNWISKLRKRHFGTPYTSQLVERPHA